MPSALDLITRPITTHKMRTFILTGHWAVAEPRRHRGRSSGSDLQLRNERYGIALVTCSPSNIVHVKSCGHVINNWAIEEEDN